MSFYVDKVLGVMEEVLCPERCLLIPTEGLLEENSSLGRLLFLRVFWLPPSFPEARGGGHEGGAYQEMEHGMMKV